jgi:hydrogenase expression/formation protein HypC
MCLAIPGQIVEVHEDGADLATVDVSGVRRRVNIGLLEGQSVTAGDWVLIHVGFAMNKIGEEQAREQMRMIAILGEDEAALEEVKGYNVDRVDERGDTRDGS